MQYRYHFWRAALAWGIAVLALSPLAGFAAEAEGGDQVYDIQIDGIPWRVHVFTTVGTNDFTVLRGGPMEYLIVGGGGGGNGSSGSSGQAGGGGGAGGFRTGTVSIQSGVLPVAVGDGGLGVKSHTPNRGLLSSFAGVEAAGGGGGDGRLGSSQNGGSGGGGQGTREDRSGASGNVPPTEPPQGHDGGTGGTGGGAGGGGAGEPGHDHTPDARAGDGGDGRMSDITGTPTYYAGGGGGGGRYTTAERGLGGKGGGGHGGDRIGSGTMGQDAHPNTGGGGGGSAFNASGAGNGGSGIVVIRYRIAGTTILVR